MTNTELILNMLAEASTKDISQATNPETFEENAKVAERGGKIAGDARKALETQTGRKPAHKELPKAGRNGFDWTFIQDSTFVLRLNFCDKNPRLRQYPNRWW